MADVLDISRFFQPRQRSEMFSVWYDPATGKITGIAPTAPNDSGIFITGSGKIYVDLLSGDVPFKEYVVAYDPKQGISRLMHINEWGGLLGEKHELHIIPFLPEQHTTMQFFLLFYKEQKSCELIVNHDSFVNMFKMSNEKQISQSQRQTISFYVRDRETGYLVARHSFEFDLNSDSIMESKADWLDEIEIDNIEVLGHKNMCTYSWSWQEKKIERVVRVSRTRVIPATRKEENFHLSFRIYKGKLMCDSNIADPANYNIYEDLHIWITKQQHPDALIGMIKVPIALIRNRNTFELDGKYLHGIGFNDIDLLTDNQYIKLHMKETT